MAVLSFLLYVFPHGHIMACSEGDTNVIRKKAWVGCSPLTIVELKIRTTFGEQTRRRLDFDCPTLPAISQDNSHLMRVLSFLDFAVVAPLSTGAQLMHHASSGLSRANVCEPYVIL